MSLLGTSVSWSPASQVSFENVVARAFVITDEATLTPFAFDRVLSAITSESDRWRAQIVLHTEPSTPDAALSPFAGFIPTTHRRWIWPQPGWSYMRPIALVNRFDLAPSDYSNCGEYRLIFSQRTEAAARRHIAIETTLPNPDRRRGSAGCSEIASFWLELPVIDDPQLRGDRLASLFFKGWKGSRAILDRRNFEKSGRIRISDVGVGRPKFEQYAVGRGCASLSPCAPTLTRVALDNMPAAALFDASIPGDRGRSFRREFLDQISALAIPDVNQYSVNLGNEYSVSDLEAVVPQFNYQLPFRASLQAPTGKEFRQQILQQLRRIGSTLTPEEIIGRAETLNCMGCHGKPGSVGDGLTFPNAFETGEHITDDTLVRSARLSPALENVFLPYRVRRLKEYLSRTTTNKIAHSHNAAVKENR